MRHHRSLRIAVAAALAACGLLGAEALAATHPEAPADGGVASRCSADLADHGSALPASAHRACVIAVAGTYLDAQQDSLPARSILFDPAVSIYPIDGAPSHAAGNAERYRAAVHSAAGITQITDRQWTVDGDTAFVAFAGYTKSTGPSQPAFYRAERFTIRRGLIWEILQTPQQNGPPGGAGTPTTPVALVAGPPDPPPTRPDDTNPVWCSDRIAGQGDPSLTPAEHHACMIAIASTYVNAEENAAPGNQILFDPRVSRYSLGGQPEHNPSNSDEIRTQEGTYQSTYNRVIRQITDRQWTVDGDMVWIAYHGYLVISTSHPGFYVAERFTIRNGLIYEIMIAPIATRIP